VVVVCFGCVSKISLGISEAGGESDAGDKYTVEIKTLCKNSPFLSKRPQTSIQTRFFLVLRPAPDPG